MIRGSVQIGDPVVYTMRKVSPHPGKRAHDIDPAPRGELYVYLVDKLWAVAEVRDDGQLVVVTRRGKRYVLAKDDPNLRRPTLWERLRYWARFPRAG
ncbi:MAG: hypothetical protein IT457_11935 [Planctomycetes bacterium]|jgi:hypothetical protein|nr:hypothetical protein [Planctomycetota bacterium]